MQHYGENAQWTDEAHGEDEQRIETITQRSPV